jgi:hypothetical protein
LDLTTLKNQKTIDEDDDGEGVEEESKALVK